jgi:hypothetical protein
MLTETPASAACAKLVTVAAAIAAAIKYRFMLNLLLQKVQVVQNSVYGLLSTRMQWATRISSGIYFGSLGRVAKNRFTASMN